MCFDFAEISDVEKLAKHTTFAREMAAKRSLSKIYISLILHTG